MCVFMCVWCEGNVCVNLICESNDMTNGNLMRLRKEKTVIVE